VGTLLLTILRIVPQPQIAHAENKIDVLISAMLTVFRPRIFAKAITHRPTPELAAFCTTQTVTSEALSSLGLGGVLITLGYSAGRKTTIDVTDLI
jgi:hypothetical protein